ncbi:MAG: hypothetical protein ACKV19_23340 [Verrucomicrobiales bacterium]
MDDSRNSPDPRYGAWKFIEEIELEDMRAHPVWLWCTQLGLPDEDDGPIDGDETSMRPLLETDSIPLDHAAPPLILLQVAGTDFYASGLYNIKKKILESISVFAGGSMSAPARVPSLPDPVIYVAVPSIGGRRDVRFRSESKSSDEATQEV